MATVATGQRRGAAAIDHAMMSDHAVTPAPAKEIVHAKAIADAKKIDRAMMIGRVTASAPDCRKGAQATEVQVLQDSAPVLAVAGADLVRDSDLVSLQEGVAVSAQDLVLPVQVVPLPKARVPNVSAISVTAQLPCEGKATRGVKADGGPTAIVSRTTKESLARGAATTMESPSLKNN